MILYIESYKRHDVIEVLTISKSGNRINGL
jgi:hypothetical protein